MRVMNFRLILRFTLILFIAAHSVLLTAQAMTRLNVSRDTWFLGLGGGGASVNLPSNMTVFNGSAFSPPNNQDIFTIHYPSTGILQLDLGYRFHRIKTYIPYYYLYLQYRHYFGSRLSGSIDQYSLPGFINYDYKMNYGADLFTLNGKFDLIQHKRVLPYLAGGIGFILNHFYDYNESALAGVTPRISPNYGGNTNAKLAVTLGAGLDFILTECVSATLGYEHLFQNAIESGPGTGSWSNTTLKTGNVSMDMLFINLTVNFSQRLGIRS